MSFPTSVRKSRPLATAAANGVRSRLSPCATHAVRTSTLERCLLELAGSGNSPSKGSYRIVLPAAPNAPVPPANRVTDNRRANPDFAIETDEGIANAPKISDRAREFLRELNQIFEAVLPEPEHLEFNESHALNLQSALAD